MDAEMDGMATGLSNCITKDGQTTVSENIPFNGKRITNLGTPSTSTDGATKGYVDQVAGNVAGDRTVRVATTANITIATALNNGDSLDGVTLADGDLVLVKDQSSAAQNGIYVVADTPARDGQYDTFDEHCGKLISVQAGTANADSVWLCTSNEGGTLDTNDLDFEERAASDALRAANNLSDVDSAATAFGNIAQFASAAEVTTGTETGKSVSPATAPGLLLGILSDRTSSVRAASTGSWVTRVLNTEDYDLLSILSISSNQFTISQAGTYEIEYEGQFTGESSGRMSIRLYDVTGTAELDVGMAGRGGNVSGTSSNSTVSQHLRGLAVVTIAGSRTFRIEGYVSDSATDGDEFGAGHGDGTLATQLTRVIIRRA